MESKHLLLLLLYMIVTTVVVKFVIIKFCIFCDDSFTMDKKVIVLTITFFLIVVGS